jgi:hypothetical protein
VVPHIWNFFTNTENIGFDSPMGCWDLFAATLQGNAREIWDEIFQMIPAAANPDDNLFKETLKEFIAVYADPEDRADQLAFLRNARKPRNMTGQRFEMALITLNFMTEWLPGTAEILDDTELKRAYLTAMPTNWQDRFTQIGRGAGAKETLTKMRHYFAKQERLSLAKQAAEQARHKRNNNQEHQPTGRGRAKRDRIRDSSDTQMRDADPFGSNTDQSQAHKRQKTSSNQHTSMCIPNDTPCPVHPGTNHVWGSCRLNKNNQFTHKPLSSTGSTPPGDKATSKTVSFVAETAATETTQGWDHHGSLSPLAATRSKKPSTATLYMEAVHNDTINRGWGPSASFVAEVPGTKLQQLPKTSVSP